MIKGVLILLGVYFLYYGTNIIYDLFLKKDKTVETDVSEEFSLEEVAGQQHTIAQVQIEDVENVKMPDSFVTNGFQSKDDMIESARPDLEDLRNRFEAEQDMDEEIREAPIFREAEDKQAVSKPSNHTQEETEEPMTNDTVLTQKEQPEPKKNDWQEMLRMSETSVQLVANYEGQKVYSII
ncbi:hypothetical protein SD427_18760 (plasmid) [Chryseobacterium sp. JJR-5R]|uniref:hypothetical protein n=1 Tax=Chryseobacterium sp. JJR-5R TaxID=3093923 RepID=UPI002A75AC9A|nr:hypothetical protein [Chryseobacterium sp. JJR-5R]WPO84641.1 hypothetical protein SD427_18760 [Chryseobacterium sp. JJR-5R]